MSNEEQHICPWRRAYLFDNILRRLLHNPKKILGEYVKPGDTVADFGCGMGFFSLAMARMVGEKGKVISVDLQPEMLTVLISRAKRRGLQDIIQPHNCEVDTLGVSDQLDFALAFWMVHEVPDAGKFLHEVHSILKPGASLLIAEPKGHITSEKINEYKSVASNLGFTEQPVDKIRMSVSLLFIRQ